MNHFDLYNSVCFEISKLTTKKYSTSFSLGIKLLDKKFQIPIYSIYGFFRFADEIVDTFHKYKQAELLAEFKKQTYLAIERQVSTNPLLHSFQQIVRKYNIEKKLIDTFLQSMEMDLAETNYNQKKYEKYILGSAEVVGLMSLRIFTDGNEKKYQQLKPAAMKLGAAFQKVNFLRDLNYDAQELGRVYFPNADVKNIDNKTKNILINEINNDFEAAKNGLKKLNKSSRLGVFLAYLYYLKLLKKIKKTDVKDILIKRVRISNLNKFITIFSAYFRNLFNLI